MTSRDLSALRDEVGQVFNSVRILYERVCNLSPQNSSLCRVQEIFAVTDTSRYPVTPEPYRPITDYFCISFDLSDGFSCKLEVVEPFDADLQGRSALLLVPDVEKATSWLAFEFRLPWREVRPASRVSMTWFGAPAKSCRCGVQIFVWDMDGTRHDINPVSEIQMQSDSFSHRLDFKIALPRTVAIDFEREPALTMFLDPTVPEYVISDFYLDIS